jgi:hypothetical protein
MLHCASSRPFVEWLHVPGREGPHLRAGVEMVEFAWVFVVRRTARSRIEPVAACTALRSANMRLKDRRWIRSRARSATPFVIPC